MRLYVKLAVIVSVGVVTQGWIERHEADLDEAQFAFRCFVAKLGGLESNHPSLMEAAAALSSRQWERYVESLPPDSRWATTRPTCPWAALECDALVPSPGIPGEG